MFAEDCSGQASRSNARRMGLDGGEELNSRLTGWTDELNGDC